MVRASTFIGADTENLDARLKRCADIQGLRGGCGSVHFSGPGVWAWVFRPAWLPLLLALTLALLNPLACLIHCLPRHATPSTGMAGYAGFCHLPSARDADAAPAATLTNGQAATPQAAFAFIPPLLAWLSISTRRAATATVPLTVSPQRFVRPLLPPPR